MHRSNCYHCLMTNSSKKKSSVALSSVFASGLMTFGKLIVGLMTGSMGILSEAAHSLLDLGAASLTFFAVRAGDKPADDNHHYGHGKIESVSALVETGLLFLTSAWIIYEAIHRLVSGNTEIEVTWYSFAVIIASIAIDIGRSRALMRVARETHSQALEADALHFRSDILSSCVVLAGLALSLLGVQGSDTFAAIGVSMFVLHAGWQLGKRTIDTLIDAAPHGMADEIRKIVLNTPGVLYAERIRTRSHGSLTFIDAEVSFDRKLSLAKTDKIITEICHKLDREYPGADVTIHPRTGQSDNESLIETTYALANAQELQIHEVTADSLDGKRYLTYHLEVPSDMTVRQAHTMTDNFERLLRSDLGSDIEIYTHIEPATYEVVASESLTKSQNTAIIDSINQIVKDNQLQLDPHDIAARTIDGRLFITLHCLTDGDMPIETAHHEISRLEYLIKDRIPSARNVSIHIEPQPKKRKS